jgi:hypothetical protein
MLSVTLDTSCCIDLYTGTGTPNAAILSILRLGMMNRVDVKVSDVAEEEVSTAKDPAGRSLFLSRLQLFPRLPTRDPAERDRVASEMLVALFPGSPPTSSSYDNNRRDCLHLAAHSLAGRGWFITLDKRLLNKRLQVRNRFGISLGSPEEALAAVNSEMPKAADERSLAVRPYEERDEGAVRSILKAHHTDGPAFESWLTSVLSGRSDAQITIGEMNGQPLALAIWRRESNTVLISSFYVLGPGYAADLGSHLLFHLVRTWATTGVDLAEARVPLTDGATLRTFYQQGFLVLGVGPRASSADGQEARLIKHFKRVLANETTYRELVQEIGVMFSRPQDPGGIFADDRVWIFPPTTGSVQVSADLKSGRIDISSTPDAQVRSFTALDLEVLLHPLRVTLPSRRALLVPIHPAWADQMMSYPHKQQELFGQVADSLLIRTDNVYYCYPRCEEEITARSPILFYVTSPVSACVGEARILQWTIDVPEVLHGLFGDLGVYDVTQIAGHVKTAGSHSGMAVALRFSRYIPFHEPVFVTKLRGLLGYPRFAPQGLHPISIEDFEAIRAEGGLAW